MAKKEKVVHHQLRGKFKPRTPSRSAPTSTTDGDTCFSKPIIFCDIRDGAVAVLLSARVLCLQQIAASLALSLTRLDLHD